VTYPTHKPVDGREEIDVERAATPVWRADSALKTQLIARESASKIRAIGDAAQHAQREPQFDRGGGYTSRNQRLTTVGFEMAVAEGGRDGLVRLEIAR
jgi:hypothetical protein